MLAAVVVASEVAIRLDGAWSSVRERTATHGLRREDAPQRGE